MDDFFISLQNQTNADFDVLVINDGIKNFETYKAKYASLNIIEVKAAESPAKNREIGINTVLELGYKCIVFGDSDDYFSENRIKRSIKSLEENDLVFNELTVFGESFRIENFLAKEIKNLDRIQETIFDGNVFGLSNIAVRSEMILRKLDFDKNLIAVDWFFITTLLIQNNYKIKFLGDVQTYYRQYNNNTIGMSLLLTDQKLELGIKVKEIHYSALIRYCNTYALESYTTLFENKLKQIQNLKVELKNDAFKRRYIKFINSNFKAVFTGWWSEIINLETYFKYENKN
nr:hypothetical protein [Gelidibacter sp. F63206]